MPPAGRASFPTAFCSCHIRRHLRSLFSRLRMNSASSSRFSTMPLQSDSSFWQLMAKLAEEPDLGWLGWVLCQRDGVATRHGATAAIAEAAAWPSEVIPVRSRTGVRAAFLEGEDEATQELHRAESFPDSSFCRRQATCHFGPRPLEALRLLERSVHPRVWKMYRAGLNRFVAFREISGLPSAWPLPKEQIRGFLEAMDSQHQPSQKILGYLAGLAYISRMFDFADPLQDLVISRMAISLSRRQDIQRRGWTPLSLEMLHCLVGVMDSVCTSFYNRVLFRAVFILSWVAALRPEEMVAEDGASLQPTLLHLSDFQLSEDAIDIRLRVFGVGPKIFVLHLTRAEEPWLCPVLAISNYLAARPRREGPFFIHGNGEPLTKAQFLAVLDPTLRLLGLLPQQFGLHSFWMGATITAVRCQVPEEVILRLARCPDRGNLQ